MLPSSHPSGISHSIVSSTRWRKFLWVSLYGYGSSSSAGRKRDSITVCCRFLLYDDDNSLSFLVKDKQKLFFLPRWWRWWRLFWQQSDICWTNTLLLRQICTFFCQNFESSGWRAARKKSTQTLMNMSSKCWGISKKTQSRNSCKKRETKNDNMQSNYQVENSTIRNQI